MSHSFFEGTVYHKRYTPKVHEFTYPFYLLDIDLSLLDRLKNRLFSFEGVNLFSFSILYMHNLTMAHLMISYRYM